MKRSTSSTSLHRPGGDQGNHPTPQKRMLIADDDLYVRQFLELVLRKEGYEVISAANGHELVQKAQQHIPNLILADLMMPEMDGYEAIRQIRNDTRTAHIPILILTARTRAADLVVGFETGADDYIAKPFDTHELLARVKSHLRRAARQPVLNALSGLPGNTLLVQEIRHRLHLKHPFALLYADLDSFKAFNDTYGFSRGDRAILTLANILQRVVAMCGNSTDFIGHIGGDDFALLTTPERVDPICRAIIDHFDQEISALYHPDDWQRGYLSGTDRYGILRRFKLMTISIGVVTTQHRTFDNEEEMARVAAEMKLYAKAQAGSSYAVDQRVRLLGAQRERRGLRRRSVLIVSNDSSLRTVLRTTLQEHSYSVHETDTLTTLRQILNEVDKPSLVLADAQLGAPLWEWCAEHARALDDPPIAVLVHDETEVAQALAIGTLTYLQQPLPLAEVIACVERLTASAERINSDGAGARVAQQRKEKRH